MAIMYLCDKCGSSMSDTPFSYLTLLSQSHLRQGSSQIVQIERLLCPDCFDGCRDTVAAEIGKTEGAVSRIAKRIRKHKTKTSGR